MASFKNKSKGIWEIVQLVKCSLSEWNLSEPTFKKQIGVVACTYNPSAREVGTGGSLGLTGQPGNFISVL